MGRTPFVVVSHVGVMARQPMAVSLSAVPRRPSPLWHAPRAGPALATALPVVPTDFTVAVRPLVGTARVCLMSGLDALSLGMR